MVEIQLATQIEAPVNRVFDLSRSIDIHKLSVADTNEEAIAGTTTGLIGLGETVTWKAHHLFRDRFMTIEITEMDPFHFFEDCMIDGDFIQFRHRHYFEPVNDGTLMSDQLQFESPYGWLGKLVDKAFMQFYLAKFLKQRNAFIKQVAESDGWKSIL